MGGGRSLTIGLIVLTLFLDCSSKKLSMELNDNIENESKINEFILSHFHKTDNHYKNPIFPYKVEYINSENKFSFCGIPILKSWAFKNGRSFAFYMLVENNFGVIKSIISVYGNHTMESEVQVNDHLDTSRTFYWDFKKYTLILKKHTSENLVAIRENRLIIVFGNVDYKDLFSIQFKNSQ
jgi:hypothetical protein